MQTLNPTLNVPAAVAPAVRVPAAAPARVLNPHTKSPH